MALPLPYVSRLVDPLIAELFAELPALMLVGPRASGKTTTALRYGKSTIRLDRLDRVDSAGAARANPDVALASYDEPIVIDEWQIVPKVLGAVKRAVDARPTPRLADYIGLALRGGYREVVRVSGERAHKAWLASYVDQLVTRDAPLPESCETHPAPQIPPGSCR